MKFLKQIIVEVSYLLKIREFNRNLEEEQCNTMLYSSKGTISGLENDIDSGIGIKEPVMIVLSKDGALMEEGNHRLAAASNKGVTHLKANVYID